MARNAYLVVGLTLLLLSPMVEAKRQCEPSLTTEVLVLGGVFAGTFAGVMVAGPAVLSALGFGSTGVVGGSVAAGMQSSIGNVAGGSVFAKLQSLGMTGVTVKSAATIAAWAAKSGIGEPLEMALGLNCMDVPGWV